MSLRTLSRIAFGIALLVIVGGSFASGAVVRLVGEHDKAVHLAGYFALALLAALGWPRWRGVALVGLPLLGLALEAAQGATGRAFEWSDALANAAGIGLAVTLSVALTRWIDRE